MAETVQVEDTHGRAAKAKVQAVLVLGMHRSGTSALTKALNLLGAALPARLMAALPQNPSGFFEPAQIVDIHDRLLASAGSSWSDWGQFPRAWYNSHAREDFAKELIQAVEQDFGASRLFVLKDPRICRFVPLWLAMLKEIGAEPVVALPYRNPIEVAKSLAIRDGFPLAKGYLLWLRHVLKAERETRGCARTFLRYEDLVAEPRPTIDRVMSALPVAWPRQSAGAFQEIEAFLDHSLRRNQAPAGALNRSDVPQWVRDAYTSYGQLESDPDDRVAREKLDEIYAAFNAASGSFLPAFHGLEMQLDEARRKIGPAEQLQIAPSSDSTSLSRAASASAAVTRPRNASNSLRGNGLRMRSVGPREPTICKLISVSCAGGSSRRSAELRGPSISDPSWIRSAGNLRRSSVEPHGRRIWNPRWLRFAQALPMRSVGPREPPIWKRCRARAARRGGARSRAGRRSRIRVGFPPPAACAGAA
jgi:hypothetical protein